MNLSKTLVEVYKVEYGVAKCPVTEDKLIIADLPFLQFMLLTNFAFKDAIAKQFTFIMFTTF